MYLFTVDGRARRDWTDIQDGEDILKWVSDNVIQGGGPFSFIILIFLIVLIKGGTHQSQSLTDSLLKVNSTNYTEMCWKFVGVEWNGHWGLAMVVDHSK